MKHLIRDCNSDILIIEVPSCDTADFLLIFLQTVRVKLFMGAAGPALPQL
jgi:hypothetical protein